MRRYGCTWFNYIGKPLAYVLATPERPDDLDNPLRVAMGNESTHADVKRFSERFGLHVFDGYGATESGLNILRTPETPPNAMGPLPEGVAVLHQETGEPAAVARFDADGRLLNGPEAVGEMVNTQGPGAFLGYYGDEEAEHERMRGGMYRSGDLAYVDEQRLRLLRRPHQRLAAGGRREPGHGAHRAVDPAPSRRGPGGGLRRPQPGRRATTSWLRWS